MGDLIDRKALLDSMDGRFKEKQHIVNDNLAEGFVQMEKLIKEQPIVDAVPVVHAEWIDTQPDYHNGFYRNAHKCSNCSDYYTTEYYDLFFCPRCGAKMDGKKVEE